MPNWCENRLVVKGERAVVEGFKNKVANGSEVLDLAQLVPKSAWRVVNWGATWNPEWLADMGGDESLEYRFDTAWDPPIEWVEQASALYPNLKFTLWFEESGTQLAGMVVFENGEIWNRCRI